MNHCKSDQLLQAIFLLLASIALLLFSTFLLGPFLGDVIYGICLILSPIPFFMGLYLGIRALTCNEESDSK